MTFSLILRSGQPLVVDYREVLPSDDEVFRGSVEQCCNEQDRLNRYRPMPVLKPITTQLLPAPRV